MATQEFGSRQGNGLRHISEALPAFHRELAQSTEQALRNNPEIKAMNRKLRYEAELSVWAKLTSGSIPQDHIAARTQASTEGFQKFPREGQIVLYETLYNSNTAELSKRFNDKLQFLLTLRRENGEDPEVIAEAKSRMEKVFRNQPRMSRPDEMKHLDSEIDHLLRVSFPRYIENFEQILSFTERGEAAIKDEINDIKLNFETSSDKDKARIARELRTRVQTWPETQFDIFISKYKKLINLGVIKTGRRGIFSEEDWYEKFNEAKTLEQRVKIVTALELVVQRNYSTADRSILVFSLIG